MVRIIIEVEGGLVQAVYSNEPDAQLAILDLDNMKDGDCNEADRIHYRCLKLETESLHEVS